MSTYPRVRYDVDSTRAGADRGFWKHDDRATAMVVPADAIVIERADLPEVTTRGGSVSVKVFTWSDSSADDLREVAACYLAAAEYLSAHPPVPPVSDEDVETLAGMLDTLELGPVEWTSQVARRLLAAGHLSVTK